MATSSRLGKDPQTKEGNVALRSAFNSSAWGAGILVTGLLTALVAVPCGAWAQAQQKRKVLGKERIFYIYGGTPEHIRCANLVHSRPNEWRSWRAKHIISGRPQTWFKLLRNPVEKAVDILTTIDYGGNPNPVVIIDEFGLDLGGQTDRKTATILRAAKGKMPQLGIVVWQMRGPVSPVLADAYRDVVDLVCMEAYVGSKDEYWKIIGQVKAAQLQGLGHKAVVGIGLGVGGRPGEHWAKTKKELEQQIRFIRLIAPESPGLAFFSPGSAKRGEEGLLEYASALCERFGAIPTDGTALPEDVIALHGTFAKTYHQPMLVASGTWVEPNRAWTNPSTLVKPKTMNATILNLGEKGATNVKVRLLNREDKGGNVFAEGIVNVPARGVATAILPVIADWQSWKDWPMEVEVPGGEALIFPKSK